MGICMALGLYAGPAESGTMGGMADELDAAPAPAPGRDGCLGEEATAPAPGAGDSAGALGTAVDGEDMSKLRGVWGGLEAAASN